MLAALAVYYFKLLKNIMSAADLTETTTPLYTKGLFEENDLPPEHKNAKTHRIVQCLNCP